MKNAYEVFNEILNSKPNVRIKLLGDSITHGMGGTGFERNGRTFIEGFAKNPNGYCWANMFKRYMQEKFGSEVVNYGCSGTDIEFIVKNFDILVEKADDLIICTIGTNNRHFWFRDGAKPTREAFGRQFYENILKIYNMVKVVNKEIIFMANIPASDAREQSGENFWQILHMDDINAIYKAASEKMGFPMISMYDLFTEYCKVNAVTVDSLLKDGLHPNDRGYKVMYDLLIKELRIS